MADNRIHRTVAQRLDIRFNLRPNHWRNWRRLACWLGGILPLGLLGWSFLPGGKGDQTLYQSGAVSTVHQGFADDCGACHVKPFQPLCLLIGTSEDKREIENQACGTCHPKDKKLDHSKLFQQQSVADQVVDCFDCHREHQGADRLLAVADAHCLTCHGDMNKLISPPNMLTFHTAIRSFHAHPEFAVVDPKRNLQNTIHQAAYLVGAQSRQDTSPFHFNHAAHLKSDGVLLPHSHPEHTEQANRKKLGCADCHRADGSGAYMQPISYELHCADCHPLAFTTKLAQSRNAGVELASPSPLPHGSEEALHGVIRDRLLAFAREQKPVDTNPNGAHRPQLPNKSRAAPAPSQSEYEFAERELNGIRWEEEIVQRSLGATGRVVREGCAFCHHIEADNDFNPIQDFPWKVSRNGVGGVLPDRWMPHSRFRHDRHNSFGHDVLRQLLQMQGIDLAIDWGTASAQEIADAHCITCHQGTLASESAKSVLMPSIQVCHNCHGATSKAIGFAQANCVKCHDYHSDHAVDGDSISR